MRLIHGLKDKFVFQLGQRERDLLSEVLKLYPCLPAAYQPLSKSAAPEEASRKLLQEALAEQRAENKQQIREFLTDPKRWATHELDWRLSLSPAEVEWLLQILNDIRVGSWVNLGSPEGRCEVLNEKTLPHLWAMEMAGSFQMYFLEVLEGKARRGREP